MIYRGYILTFKSGRDFGQSLVHCGDMNFFLETKNKVCDMVENLSMSIGV